MTFREYRPSDQDALIEVFNDFLDYFVDLDPLKRVRRLPDYGKVYIQKVLEKMEKNKGKFILVEEDKRIIGLVVGIVKIRSGDDLLEGFPSTYGEIIELYVDEEYRSKNIGTELMEKLEAYFRDQNCDAVFVEVFAPNVRARSFYAKHGYGERDISLIKLLK